MVDQIALGAVVGGLIGAAAVAVIGVGGAMMGMGANLLGMGLSGGGLALANGMVLGAGAVALAGAAGVVVGGAIIIEGIKIAISGLNVLFSKDNFIKFLERGMSENQKEMFQREIEDLKTSEGRGGADNLAKELLREIAEWIKTRFK